LRIATELYLKRLIVGGYERVYEIGKNFRNEGMDRSHNPEFTLLEMYQAYSDLEGMMDITENMVHEAAMAVLGTDQVPYQGQVISVAKPWRRAPMLELIKEKTGLDASDFDTEKLEAFLKQHKVEIPKNAGPGKLIAEIFDAFVQETLIQPTFVYDYPKEVSPLAKSKPGYPQLVERFELFINGNEYANAFTELNDPLDQRERMEKQAQLRALGDLEATDVDEDFLEALEYGMPPMGGMGIGIDRLVMLLTDNTSIKEVIFFPQMKRT
ncbi:MAG TPA: lysine--tRNA ligase, partial [Candidatus Cloacimonadota bacterium]|nr:lysine--tRNA ligase [Candidatus Cloacimonadota bacterium]